MLILIPAICSMIALLFSNTIPSQMSIYAGLIFGVTLGSLLMTMVIVGYRAGCYSNNKTPIFQKPWVLTTSAFFLGFMFGYFSLAWTAPWAITSYAGTRSEEVVTVKGWRTGGTRSCSGPDIGKGLFILAPRALCLPSNTRNQMPVGTRIKLVGPTSVFGMNVESVYIVH